METLTLYRGEQVVAQIALGPRPLELGRSAACDVMVNDPGLAERHVLVVRKQGGAVAYDVSVGRAGPPEPLPFGRRSALGCEHSLLRERLSPACATPNRAATESIPLAGTPGPRLCVVVGRGRDARKLRIGERPLHVGRGEQNDLVLHDAAASESHCRLEPSEAGLVLRDLASRNGTFVNGVRVERVVLAAAQIRIGRTELAVIEQEPAASDAGGAFVAESARMLALVAEVERAASLPWPALVVGESGSGKEGIATLLHERGARRSKAFLAVNAGGIPRELIESELFGHERGAFTGAAGVRRGVFELADGGTLFLDEIGELPLELQARLLRVLETGELRRVGGESVKRVDVRVVCATHRDLRAMVRAGRFREDLLYRLARLVFEVPPLRQRPEDVLALSARFLGELESVLGRRELAKDARAWLSAYAWPGNVRELRNLLSVAAFASTAARIEREELERALERIGGRSVRRPLSLEPNALAEALNQHAGNLSAAARALQVPRSTLRDRVKISSRT